MTPDVKLPGCGCFREIQPLGANLVPLKFRWFADVQWVRIRHSNACGSSVSEPSPPHSYSHDRPAKPQWPVQVFEPLSQFCWKPSTAALGQASLVLTDLAYPFQLRLLGAFSSLLRHADNTGAWKCVELTFSNGRRHGRFFFSRTCKRGAMLPEAMCESLAPQFFPNQQGGIKVFLLVSKGTSTLQHYFGLLEVPLKYPEIAMPCL